MSRLRSNCRVNWVFPTELEDVISVTSAIVPRCRSSGVATLVAMVSGLAPAMLAEIEMVGWSTWGSGETGSFRKAVDPASTMAAVKRVVATGLLMNSSERLMRRLPLRPPRSSSPRRPL